MTGTNFLNTPDGRPGWGDFFLGKGYEVSKGSKTHSAIFPQVMNYRFTLWTSPFAEDRPSKLVLTVLKARTILSRSNHASLRHKDSNFGRKRHCILNGLEMGAWETLSLTAFMPQPYLVSSLKRKQR